MQPLGGCRVRMAAFRAATARRASIERLIASDHPARPGVEDGGHVDKAGGDCDVGDVGHPQLVGTIDHPVAGKVREDRTGVIAVRGGDESLTALGLQVVFAHKPADLLGIDDDAAMAQLGSNPAVPVSLELIADCDYSRDDLGVIGFA